MENIIKIHLKERNDYKNTYNEKILSYKLRDYILEELKGITTKKKIKFIISSDFDMNDLEKNNLVDMIRNNFGADISEIINLSKKQLIANLLILFPAIILIIIYSLLKIKLIAQFILIFGWVLLGEVICNLMYKGIDNKHKITRRKQIVTAKIIFEQQKEIKTNEK